MEQAIKKAIKTGYGLGLLSLQEAGKVVQGMRKELDLNDEESKALARELVRNSKQASKEVVGAASKYIEQALTRTGLASKTELKLFQKLMKKRIKDKLAKLRR